METMRVAVDLRDDQLAALQVLCAEEGISRAEAVRRAIDGFLPRRPTEEDRAQMLESFGAWKHMKLDGLEYTRAIREEWDDRERRLGLK